MLLHLLKNEYHASMVNKMFACFVSRFSKISRGRSSSLKMGVIFVRMVVEVVVVVVVSVMQSTTHSHASQ